MDNIQVGKLLGRGSYGTVYLARDLLAQKCRVLKRVRICDESLKEKEKVEVEIKILSSFDHPNIVKCHDSFMDSQRGVLCLVMEYCSKGDLYHCITKQNGVLFPEKEILIWFHQMLLGLEHVHNHRVIHRDIKTKNIFLTKFNVVKIGDFGCSRVLGTMELAKSFVGTPCYMAPELGTGKPYDYKTDVWALGCVLYELTCLHPPFQAENLYLLSKSIRKGEYKPIPSSYSPELADLIGRMMSVDPSQRPTLREILNMNYVNKTLADVYTSLLIQTQKLLGVQESVDLKSSIASEKGDKMAIDLLNSANEVVRDATDRKIQEIDKKLGEEQGKIHDILKQEDFRSSVVRKSFEKVIELEKQLPGNPSNHDGKTQNPAHGIGILPDHDRVHDDAGDFISTPRMEARSSPGLDSPASNASNTALASPRIPDTPAYVPQHFSKGLTTPKTVAIPQHDVDDEVLRGSVEDMKTVIKSKKKIEKRSKTSSRYPTEASSLMDRSIDDSLLQIESLQTEKDDMLCAQKLMKNCWMRLESTANGEKPVPSPSRHASGSPRRDVNRIRHSRHPSSDSASTNSPKKSPGNAGRVVGTPPTPTRTVKVMSSGKVLSYSDGVEDPSAQQEHQTFSHQPVLVATQSSMHSQSLPAEAGRRGSNGDVSQDLRYNYSHASSPKKTGSRGSSAGKPPLPLTSPLVSSFGSSSLKSDVIEPTPVKRPSRIQGQTRPSSGDYTDVASNSYMCKLPAITQQYMPSRSKSAPTKAEDEDPIKGRKEKYGDFSIPAPKSDHQRTLSIGSCSESPFTSPGPSRFSPKVKNL
eukprot:TRINITY_DN3405_c0_g3_i2.p1 TRINITY_DN3405_c0_g3~~TRINITY_DN3405_c0_g3_i2.p1  ORF type:complete len:808 (-),score=152.58 TRINITY_DN3405_c0_g3_i2:286-2709(-)